MREGREAGPLYCGSCRYCFKESPSDCGQPCGDWDVHHLCQEQGEDAGGREGHHAGGDIRQVLRGVEERESRVSQKIPHDDE